MMICCDALRCGCCRATCTRAASLEQCAVPEMHVCIRCCAHGRYGTVFRRAGPAGRQRAKHAVASRMPRREPGHPKRHLWLHNPLWAWDRAGHPKRETSNVVQRGGCGAWLDGCRTLTLGSLTRPACAKRQSAKRPQGRGADRASTTPGRAPMSKRARTIMLMVTPSHDHHPPWSP